MIEALFIGLILLVLAWAAHQFIPHPIGLVVAAVLAILALYVIVVAVLGDGDVETRSWVDIALS